MSLYLIYLAQHNVLRFTTIFACISNLCFFFFAEYYSTVWKYSSLFIHYPVGEHLGSFQFLDIVNKAVKNIFVQIFLWYIKFSDFCIYSKTLETVTFE